MMKDNVSVFRPTVAASCDQLLPGRFGEGLAAHRTNVILDLFELV